MSPQNIPGARGNLKGPLCALNHDRYTMINNKSVLSTSSLLNGPYRARVGQQNLPNNDGITRAADEHNSKSQSTNNDMNTQNQGNIDQLNNSEKNPSNRANDLGAQAPEAGKSATTTSDSRYTQDTPPPEYQETQYDGVNGNPTPQTTQPPPEPNKDKSLAMRYLEKKATEKLGNMGNNEGTGDQQSETNQSPTPESNSPDKADTPPDPRRKAKQPTPRQPEMSTPKMRMPKQVGPPKMRMPSLRIPKMRF